MLKKLMSYVLAAAMCAALTTTAFASLVLGFTEDPGIPTDTKIAYSFLVDDAYMAYNKQVSNNFSYNDIFFAGSDLYIPLGSEDTTASSSSSSSSSSGSGPAYATDKQIKSDNVQISYKVLQGYDYVDNVTLISGKKEKLDDLPSATYAKVEFADTYMPLDKSKVAVRLVLSVNGVSYQDSAVTFVCYLRNRIEDITRNSVHGAILPTQFRASSGYNSEVTFDFGGGVRYTARVSGGKRYYLNLDKSVKEHIKEMYPDAYLEYYDFQGHNDTFASTGKLDIPINKTKFKEKKTSSQVYVYEMVGDQLTSLDKSVVTYNHKTGKVTIETTTLGCYILSSRALMKGVKDSSEWDILRYGYAEESDVEESSSGSSSTK